MYFEVSEAALLDSFLPADSVLFPYNIISTTPSFPFSPYLVVCYHTINYNKSLPGVKSKFLKLTSPISGLIIATSDVFVESFIRHRIEKPSRLLSDGGITQL